MNAPRIYLAYLITNSVNGKGYVGITRVGTSRRMIEHRNCARHGKRGVLYDAMRKHGVAAFSIRAIACSLSWDAIVETERTLIAQHGTLGGGYNACAGVPKWAEDAPKCFTTERKPMTEAHRRAIGAALKGTVKSPEVLARMTAGQQARKARGWVHPLKGIARPAGFGTTSSLGRGGVGAVTFGGERYTSAATAAKAAGVTPATMRRWVAKLGTDIPRAILARKKELRWPNATPVCIGGAIYWSIGEAARALGMSHGGIDHWVKIGRATRVERAA